MRLLSLLLVAGVIAAVEPIPVLDLDYEADGPRPPAPIAAWWSRALDDAAAWATARAGLPVTAASFSSITSLRLAGVALPSATGRLEPWAAGWVDGLDDAGNRAVAALAAGWSGYAVRHDRDGRLLVDAAGIVPPHRLTLPGWRVSVHGAAFAAALGGDLTLPDEIDAATRERLRAVLAEWECSVITAIAGAIIDTGLPAHWFTAPDPRRAARLPASSAARGVLAIDGMALADDLEKLFPPGQRPFFLAGLADVPGANLRGLASALTGTWAAWWDGATGGLLCMPRTQVGDGLLQVMAASQKLTLPNDATVVQVCPGVVGACDGDSWLFASDASFITAWQAEPAAVPAIASGEVAISGKALAGLLAELPLELVAQLPLSDAMHGGGFHRELLAKELGMTLPVPEWRGACQDLAGLGDSRVRFSEHDGALRLDLGGDVLPWVVPGLGLRWFADQGQDLVGRDGLRRAIARLQAAKLGALPEDLLDDAPALELPRLEAAEQVMTQVQQAVKRVKMGELWRRGRREGIPLPDAAAAPQLAALLAVVEASAGMDAPDFPTASTMSVRRAAVAGTLGPAMSLEQATVGRSLLAVARELAALGRPEAQVLVRRAQRFSAQPRVLMEWLIGLSSTVQADDVMCALGVGGAVAPAELDAWLAAPPPDPAQLMPCWRRERLIGPGWMAARWLGLPIRPEGDHASAPAPPSGPLFLAPPCGPLFCAPHSERGEVAEDLVAMMETMRGLEAGRAIADVMTLPHSSAVTSLVPAFKVLAAQQTDKIVRYGLVRLAWRLRRLGPAGLPADEAKAVALVGPLQVAIGGGQLPLRYQRLSANGFTLFLDPTAPMPAGIRAELWKRWIAPAKDGAVDCFAIMPDGRMAVIIDPAAARPPPPPAAAEGVAQPPGANGF
jgi:hypothetical protein